MIDVLDEMSAARGAATAAMVRRFGLEATGGAAQVAAAALT